MLQSARVSAKIARSLSQLALAATLLFSCSTSSDGASTGQPSSSALFSKSITKIVFEIDYMPNAEPYLEKLSLPNNAVEPFGVLKSNVSSLFSATPKTLELPQSLDKMEKLTDVTGQDFTVDQILAIASAHRQTQSSGSTAAFYAVWLDGYYSKDGQRNDGVLAVSLGDTGVIAMFKPVIASVVAANERQFLASKVVEQLVFLHEFGHAVGYVNRGIPMASPHQDEANGKHCTNPECIMYWTNESFDTLMEFAKRVYKNDSTIVFDAACLKDVGVTQK